MCGLVAMHTIEKTGFLNYNKDDFKHLLILNSIRGIHSTGIAGVDSMRKDAEVEIVKSTGSPYSLFNYNHTDTFFQRMVASYTTVIGHGRYATQGDVNAINAHPFQEGHITLAHNGVIRNFHTLKDYVKHRGIEVDSHLIAKLFQENGAKETLERVEGAYVFMWYDDSDNTFNIARNNERPLSVAKQVGRDTLMFTSEEASLHWNAARNKTAIEDVHEITPHVIHKFYNDNLVPESIQYKPYSKPVSVYGYGADVYEDTVPWSAKQNTDGFNKRASLLVNKDKDSLELQNLQDVAGGIKLGDAITSEIIEYEEDTKNSSMRIYASNDNFPLCIFKAITYGIKEAQLKSSDIMKGTVSFIQPNHDDTLGASWVVYLKEPTVTSSEDDRIGIRDIHAEVFGMSRFRLKQISKCGCAWCRSPITDAELFNHTKLLLQESKEEGDSLICSSCVTDFMAATAKGVH